MLNHSVCFSSPVTKSEPQPAEDKSGVTAGKKGINIADTYRSLSGAERGNKPAKTCVGVCSRLKVSPLLSTFPSILQR